MHGPKSLLASLQSEISDLKCSVRAPDPTTPPESSMPRLYSSVVQSTVSKIPLKKPLSTSECKFNVIIYGLNDELRRQEGRPEVQKTQRLPN